MFMHDNNPEQKKIMLLIHPMLSSAEGMEICITNHLGDGFRYLIPDLSGHGDAMKDTYHNCVEEAGQIHDYMIAHDIHEVQLAFCASLGGCVLLELLKYDDITYRHLYFEGASLYKNGWHLEILLRNVYYVLRSRAIKNPEKTAQMFIRKYGEAAGQAMVRRFAGINKESIKNICHDCAHVKAPTLDEETQGKMVFAYGETDMDVKNSKAVLPKLYPKARMVLWKGYGHCERMTKDSENYARLLRVYL